jgi:tetratricopeptide (TPR) repeat protein
MNVNRLGITDRIRFGQTAQNELPDPIRYTTEEFITACERALKKYPNEWIIHYLLGGKYQEKGYYAESLRETQRCIEIRPNDIRSAYAHATSYRILTRASWSDQENQDAQV